MKRFFLGLLALSFLLCLEGCGSSPYPVARVRGKVTCAGIPLTGATVNFTPLPKNENDKQQGKTAWGKLDNDGNYVLSTFGNADGAIVGKHRVTFVLGDAYVKLACSLPDDLVLEVKANTTNELNIELLKDLK